MNRRQEETERYDQRRRRGRVVRARAQHFIVQWFFSLNDPSYFPRGRARIFPPSPLAAAAADRRTGCIHPTREPLLNVGHVVQCIHGDCWPYEAGGAAVSFYYYGFGRRMLRTGIAPESQKALLLSGGLSNL